MTSRKVDLNVIVKNIDKGKRVSKHDLTYNNTYLFCIEFRNSKNTVKKIFYPLDAHIKGGIATSKYKLDLIDTGLDDATSILRRCYLVTRINYKKGNIGYDIYSTIELDIEPDAFKDPDPEMYLLITQKRSLEKVEINNLILTSRKKIVKEFKNWKKKDEIYMVNK